VVLRPGSDHCGLASGAQKYALLLRSDVPRLEALGALKGARSLVDFGREFEMPTGGVAVGGKELDAHPERTKRFLRGLRKGFAYVRAYKDEAVASVQKRLPGTAAAPLMVDLEAALAGFTKDGTMSVETAARELVIRGELLGVAADKIPPAEKIFDFKLVREANRELDAAAWKPAR
jgi:ABC-type nitrate/sulfonate/bicarbonate transport system substrate-binding protein